MEYQEFINQKIHDTSFHGFEPIWMPDFLYDFQKHIVAWNIRKGKSATFADTGLGKTAIQLVFAQNVIEKTNKNCLLLTPIAVSHQTIKEAEKFGIDAKRSRNGKPAGKLTVTNYEQIEKFDTSDFNCIICDESSAIKNATGQTRKNVTRAMAKIQHRLMCTATPSPNDFIELGTSSEALGEMQFMEMLNAFFRDTSNDKNPQWSTPKYELKGHAVDKFWQWVSTWALGVRMPSDLGYSDERFILPELIETEHILKCTKPLPGNMFVDTAKTLKEQRQERKLTINERCEKVVELCEPRDLSVVWAHYNYETDLLHKMIDDSVDISGADSDESKEEKFIAFSNGEIKTLITKPTIGAWGLNWQHCNHTVFFPSHSFEQYYQGVRRFHRYGQKKNVQVDIVTTEGEQNVLKNIKRKANDMRTMFEQLVKHMNSEYTKTKRQEFNKEMTIPKWLQSTKKEMIAS